MEAPPPKHVSPTGMWASKLCLRILSIIFCVALAGLGGSLATTGIVATFYFVIMGPPVFVALAWSLAEGICILARGGHRGIHPGACVGVDLILWLGLVACTTMIALFGIASAEILSYYHGSYYYDDYYYYDLDNYKLGDLIGKGRAIVGLSATLTIIHFVVFVIACYETNVRNSRGPTYIVYTNTTQTAPAYGVPGAVPQQQVYYQQQPVAGQMPMYYTYAQQPVSPATTTTTPAQTPQAGYTIQAQPTPPPPIYSGNRDTKTELPS